MTMSQVFVSYVLKLAYISFYHYSKNTLNVTLKQKKAVKTVWALPGRSSTPPP